MPCWITQISPGWTNNFPYSVKISKTPSWGTATQKNKLLLFFTHENYRSRNLRPNCRNKNPSFQYYKYRCRYLRHVWICYPPLCRVNVNREPNLAGNWTAGTDPIGVDWESAVLLRSTMGYQVLWTASAGRKAECGRTKYGGFHVWALNRVVYNSPTFQTRRT